MENITGYRLSPQQRHIWLLQQSGGAPPYRAAYAVLVEGKLDARALDEAWAEVVERHSILHTTFHQVSGMSIPLQVVGEWAAPPTPRLDLSDLRPEAQERRIEELLDEAKRRPFDFAHSPPVHVSLLMLSPDRHVLLFNISALCADPATLDNLVREISRAYAHRRHGEEWPDCALPYVVASEWLNELLEAEEAEPGRQYWRKQDFSALGRLKLTSERRASESARFDPQSVTLMVDRDVSARVMALAAEYATQPSVVLLACWQTLLWRVGSDPDVIVGTAFDGRSDEELEEALGPFAKYLPVRCSLSDDLCFGEIVRRLDEATRQAREWQECFTQGIIAEAAGGEARPFFPVCFDYERLAQRYCSGEVAFSVHSRYSCMDAFEAKLSCVERGGDLQLEFCYDASLFSAREIERVGRQFLVLLESATGRPRASAAELEILPHDERQQILFGLNQTARDYTDARPIQRLFEEQAERTPGNVAVVARGREITYAELNARANQLARALRASGVGPEVLVALCVERSVEMVVGMLGILKAGGAYVPLDPAYPRERLAFMLHDSQASVLLTEQRLTARLPRHDGPVIRLDADWGEVAQNSAESVAGGARADAPAYVIYTSGSTGSPKGVVVTHKSLYNHMLWMQDDFPLTEADRVLQKTPFSFDASVWEFYAPLLAGARLVMAEPGAHQDSARLIEILIDEGITILQVVPTLLRLLLAEPRFDLCTSLRRLFCGGEVLTAQDRQNFFERSGADLINLYGPTEATIEVLTYVCACGDQGQSVPVGCPIANARAYVLDARLRPVPLGLPGELYVGGAALARGYYRRPDLTAERFVPDPFSGEPGARLYATGDLVRYLPSGDLEFLGRTDQQVKLRGQRVELGEIESVLREHPAVRDAVVLVGEGPSGDERLQAYVTPDEKYAFTVRQLLRFEREGALDREHRYALPNGRVINHYSKNETDFLYREIFEEQSYLQHGITLRAGDCVFDVGANIGMFTMFVGQVCPDARIYAFEPIPPIFEILRVNVALYGLHAKLFNCGIAAEPRDDTFTFYRHLSMMSGRFTDAAEDREIVRSFEFNQQAGGAWSDELVDELLTERLTTERFTCQLRTISDVIREHRVERIDLLKVDAEKSESDVLAGIDEADWQKIGQIVMEVQDTDGQLGRITAQLRSRGFDVAARQESQLRGTNLYDLYAVRPSHAARRAGGNGLKSSPPLVWSDPDRLIADLQSFAATRLPEYMLPSLYKVIEAMPLAPGGKVDRHALLALTELAQDPRGNYVAPRTPSEELLAGIWSEVLGLKRVGVHNNFFAVGGHSLLATQVISRARKAFRVEVPLNSLFQSPTVAGLAAEIDRELAAGDAAPAPPVVPTPREGDEPLSFAQQRLWFLEQLEAGHASYNVPLAFRLKGDPDREALEWSLNEVVRRHEALRTTFVARGGEPQQRIAPELRVPLRVIEPDADESAEPEGWARRVADEEARRPFDLERGPLLRAALLVLGPRDHVVVLTLHHIVSDGWSIGILLGEIGALYDARLAGRPSPLPELTIQYADYARWQRDWLRGETLESQLRYWREHLAGDLPPLELPTDRPRPAVQTYHGATQHFELLPGVLLAARELARREGVTLFMVLLAAFKALLHRYTRQEDIVVGSAIANRNRAETEGLIGFFVNTLVVRTRVASGQSFRELLRRVRESSLGAYAHQDMPFERLVEELQPERDLSRTPLFQVMFTLQNVPTPDISFKGLAAEPLSVEAQVAKFDLTLSMQETGEGLGGALTYNTDLFDAGTIGRLAEHFQVLTKSALAYPDRPLAELPLMSGAESRRVLSEWNETASEYPREACLHQLFEQQAERSPQATALVFDGGQLTYGELNARANRLAHHLRALGVGPEERVGVCVERGAETVVGLLAILKAGGAYVPLDPTYPRERLAFMLADAKVKVLLSQERLAADDLPSGDARVVLLDADWEKVSRERADNPTRTTSADNLVYVIYTSGSTGRPKGTMLPHRGIVNCLLWMQKRFALARSDRVMLKASLSFDASVWELFWPLAVGASVFMARPGGQGDSAYLADSITRHGVTVIHFVPSLLQHFLQEQSLADAHTLRFVIVGGEALPVETMDRFLKQSAAELHNFYGPTETSIGSTDWKCEHAAGRRTVPIGRPISNTRVFILDRQLLPTPVGIAGELHIGGDGLARGYLERPDLTAERFIPDPFDEQAGGRLYKTGDLARYLSDGDIEFLGRIDDQVKVRGFRIELGEIDALLSQDASVAAAVTRLREDRPGEKRLVAYVVWGAGVEHSAADLRARLRARLPDYMIPSAFVALDALPLTPAGKLDPKALPAPGHSRPELGTALVAPRTPVEELIAAAWCEVLGVGQIGVHDDFFALGGHSLLATQVISRVNRTCGAEMALRRLFETPTVAGLAEAVEERLRDEKQTCAPPILPVARGAELPLSFAQQRLWFLDQLSPASAAYNIPFALHLRGPLELEAFERSVNEIRRRHESLRTSIATADGKPRQVVADYAYAPLQVVDLSALPEGEREARARRLADEDARTPFDIAQAPPLRVRLLKLGARAHMLLFSTHHIISDAWSVGVLVRELGELYEAFRRGAESPLAELPIQYADYAAWQRAWLRGEVLERLVDYWKRQLGDGLPAIRLPTDRPAPAVQSFRGATLSFTLGEDLSDALKALSRREGVTLFMLLLAAFKVLLYRYAGQEDIAVGTPIANRNRAEIEGLVGFFVNTLVLRTDLSGNPGFRELLRRVREVALDAYAHQDLPFEKLVEELRPQRSLSTTPLFSVMFIMQNTPAPTAGRSDLSISPLPSDSETAKFDLTLSITETARGLSGQLNYSADLFERATAERLLRHFENLLADASVDPDRPIADLSLMSAAERRRLLADWNATRSPYPYDQRLHDLFEAQAAKTPDAIAVVCGDECLTFDQLNRRANQLAHHLTASGVGAESLVGVCLERSTRTFVALLGVLKAGGAYVPLDPSYPKDRLSYIVEDSGVALLLTEEGLAEVVPTSGLRRVYLDADGEEIARHGAENLARRCAPSDLAYVMYTSGSTGRPKGVMGLHRGAVNRLHWMWETYPFADGEVCCQKTALSFVDSVWEMFGPLLRGVTVVVLADADVRDPERLVSALSRHGVTRIVLVPSLLGALLESGVDLAGRLPRLKYWTSSGEALTAELAERFRRALGGRVLLNLYGSTEVSADAAWHEVGPDEPPFGVPLGRPVANTQLYILDDHLQPVPAGVAGELYVGGDNLSRGYLHRPELTADRFIPDAWGGEASARLYRTGDLAKYLDDGRVVYLGRADHQVKIRGNRVELGEIEAVLRRHASVSEAVVTAREGASGDRHLIAYVVAHEQHAPTAGELRPFLADRLPDYMMPTAFVFLGALPLTPNGKIDRRALPAPGRDGGAESRGFVGPRNIVELQLTHLWEELLPSRPVGVTDNFFDLGGNSILSVSLMARIDRLWGVKLPLAALFRGATIEQLAGLILSRAALPPQTSLVEIQPGGSRPAFFCVHAAGGNVLGFAELAMRLGDEQPFYGLQARGLDGRESPDTEIVSMASRYIAALKGAQMEGPYYLGGFSMGGLIAFEMAQQLAAKGERVALLALFDTRAAFGGSGEPAREPEIDDAALLVRVLGESLPLSLEELRRMGPDEQLARVLELAKAHNQLSPDVGLEEIQRLLHVYRTNVRAAGAYVPPPYAGRITLFKAQEDAAGSASELSSQWGQLARGGVELRVVPGNHNNMALRPHVEALARSLRECLEAARGSTA